jgi:phage tail sheath gpL-like
MTRYVIDAPTLLHVVANGIPVSPRHQIVAPNIIRSQALSQLLEAVRRGDLDEDMALQHHERLTDALVTVDSALAAKVKDVVPLAPLRALTTE